MSADAAPITARDFAAAIEELPLSTLHLKAAELRNSLTHLEYSNAQLEPFARPPGDSTDTPDQVCLEAIEENIVVMARYKERLELLKQEAQKRGVDWEELEKMFADTGLTAGTAEEADLSPREREALGLSTAGETSSAGLSGGAREGGGNEETAGEERMMLDGQRVGTHSAWTDGTFQMGRIGADGEIVMDVDPTAPPSRSAAATNGVQTNGVNGVAHEEEEVTSVAQAASAGANARQGGRLSDEELRRRMAEQMGEEEEGVYL